MSIKQAFAKRVKAAEIVNPEPINPEFISLGELLQRVSTDHQISLSDVAERLLEWGIEAGDLPQWKGKKSGVVSGFQAQFMTARLKYVADRGRFEWDSANGESIDYSFYGFDRQEFADFLAHKVGEPIDLFSPKPTPTTDTQPQAGNDAPTVTESGSGGVESDKAWPVWSLKAIKRAPGYRWPLSQVLKAAYIAGQPCPTPREVLEIWKLNPPPDIQVMTDGVKYNDGLRNPKEANLKAIQQSIKGLMK